jgi:hypothetical protein
MRRTKNRTTKSKTTGKSTPKDPKVKPAPPAAVGTLAPGDAADVTEGKAKGMRVKVLELVAPDKARVELPSGKTALAALSRLARAGASAPATTAAATAVAIVSHGRKKAARADGTMSCLDSAAKVLAQAGEALDCKTMVERAIEKGYWRTKGRTPAATVYAAILREIQKQGKAARFIKTDRGRFALNE